MSIIEAPTRHYPKRMKCLLSLSLFLALTNTLKALPNAHSKRLDPFERKESTCVTHPSAILRLFHLGSQSDIPWFKKKSICKMAPGASLVFLSCACQYNPEEETAKPFKNISIVPKYPYPRLVNTPGRAQRTPREIKGGFEAERMILMNLGSASWKKNLCKYIEPMEQAGGRQLPKCERGCSQ